MDLDFLKDLNPAQLEAVRYVDGPSLVIAGAGSGKTRVLTYKIAYLLKQGLPPWSILALTFTNKAAREMKERVATLVGADQARYLWMGTFHSLFARILRREAEKIGYTPTYTIYQPADSKSLVKAIIKDMALDDKVYKPSTVLGRISEAKNALVVPEAYCNDHETYVRDAAQGMPALGEIYSRYCVRCRNANAMDFDDLLLNIYLLFQNNEEVRQRYAGHFAFILVDEYQDTNFAQHEILWQLSRERQRICVVGDDAQSIYSFRGAKIDNILKFTSLYTNAKLFKLEQNYRSTQTLVGAANSLILHNQRQIRKEVFSKNEVGKPILLSEAFRDVDEGEIVANRIVRLHSRENLSYSNMAVLYRTNAQSRIFEEALRKHLIPYRIYGGHSFYEQKDIRDVLAYFRLIINPNDEEAFKRIVNYPSRGIGQTTLQRVMDAVVQNDAGVWDVLGGLAHYVPAIKAGTRAKLESFKALMDDFIGKRDVLDAYEMGSQVIKATRLMALANLNKEPETLAMRDNLSELLNGMKTFVDLQHEQGLEDHCLLADYLSEVSLLSDQDDRSTEGEDRVTLMTVHAAKGLEFDAVFVVGMEDSLFPNLMAQGSPREMEEERRLFYVALTRAKRYCFLSYSKMRYHFGTMDFCEPSRFLKEIDKQYIRFEVPKGKPEMLDGVQKIPFFENVRYSSLNDMPYKKVRRLVSTAEVTTEGRPRSEILYHGQPLRVGQAVEHKNFGRGIVKSLEGEDTEAKAVIKFDNDEGERHLLLKYAKLTLL